MRFFIHTTIQTLADTIVERYGCRGDRALLFPSRMVAAWCKDFFHRQATYMKRDSIRVVELYLNPDEPLPLEIRSASLGICAVLFPAELFSIAKSFWQHSGEGISSRRAEFCIQLLRDGILIESPKLDADAVYVRGPKRYRVNGTKGPVAAPSDDIGSKSPSVTTATDVKDPYQYIEERFGRNLDFSHAANAKLAIRRRIAGSLTVNAELKDALDVSNNLETFRQVSGFSENDVFLYPSGMSAIFNTHQLLLTARGEYKSISYGYVSTEDYHTETY